MESHIPICPRCQTAPPQEDQDLCEPCRNEYEQELDALQHQMHGHDS